MTAVRNLHDVTLEFLNFSIQEIIEVSYIDYGIQYKKAGVILMGISQDNTRQLSMFEY